jgi:hypothetical protein
MEVVRARGLHFGYLTIFALLAMAGVGAALRQAGDS